MLTLFWVIHALQFGTCEWFVSEGKVTPELHPLLEELRLHGEVFGSTDVEIPELLRAGDSAPLHAWSFRSRLPKRV